MKTQEDSKVRVVALENLKAMCRHTSAMCHRYEVVKVSRSRVHVEYSNPDEWGVSHPMVAVFPCYPSTWQGDEDNPRVVLDIQRVLHEQETGEGWQAFEHLLSCPTMWRAGLDGAAWKTERQILQERWKAAVDVKWDKDGCSILAWTITVPEMVPVDVATNDDAVVTYLRTLA